MVSSYWAPIYPRTGNGRLAKKVFPTLILVRIIFLIHLARAYALAAYKSETLADIRQAFLGLSAILNIEMDLHV